MRIGSIESEETAGRERDTPALPLGPCGGPGPDTSRGEPMQSTARGIVLAGVHQWRPTPFERWVPRALVPIANRPLVDYALGWLASGAISRVEICANSDTRALRESLGGNGNGAARPREITFYEDKMPRGPAGCVADAVGGHEVDVLVVVDATVIPEAVDLERLLDAHRRSGAALTVVATTSEDPGRDPVLVPNGLYVFSNRALRHVASKGYQDIKEMLIPRLYETGEHVATHIVKDPIHRVTGANACFIATQWVLDRLTGGEPLPDGYHLRGEAIVHEDAAVAPTARLVGPVLIGPGASIEAGATLVGPSTIGAQCAVGAEAFLCRSIVWDRATVGTGCVLDRCIMTYGARIAPDATSTGRIHHRRNRPWFHLPAIRS